MTLTKIKTAIEELPRGKRRTVKFAIGAMAGAIFGYGYYALVGCSTGGCPITSDPMISTAWGAFIGGFATA